jgi:hypothetical protein
MGKDGWRFKTAEEVPGCIPDTVNNGMMDDDHKASCR